MQLDGEGVVGVGGLGVDVLSEQALQAFLWVAAHLDWAWAHEIEECENEEIAGVLAAGEIALDFLVVDGFPDVDGEGWHWVLKLR